MVEGRLRKFYEEVVLTSQTFVIDGETRIEKLLQNAAGDVGGEVALKGFVRFELGAVSIRAKKPILQPKLLQRKRQLVVAKQIGIAP